MKIIIIFILVALNSIHPQPAVNQQTDTTLIWNLISSNEEKFKDFISSPAKYEVQIIYTQINRDADNYPHFNTSTFNLNSKEYFYPASTVKLPAAILALEKINELNLEGLDCHTPMRIDSVETWQTRAQFDSTSENGLPSVAHYIKKILLVSDNDAYNRLYEFLGQEYFNEKLRSKGLNDCRMVSRLSVFLSPEQNACTNPVTFYKNDKIIFAQDQVCNKKSYPNKLQTTTRGIGYYQKDSLINEPKDFSNSNYISLEALHGILKRIIFPEAFPVYQRFNLTEKDYHFIYKYIGMFPHESIFPKYNSSDYPDNYVKFFMFWEPTDSLYKSMRIYNKVGQAYGYLIDNAYIVDLNKNIEFLLSAMIYVNEDQIFNDDKYEYDEIGFPFLSNLGNIIYNYELSRERKTAPNQDKFNLNFNDID